MMKNLTTVVAVGILLGGCTNTRWTDAPRENLYVDTTPMSVTYVQTGVDQFDVKVWRHESFYLEPDFQITRDWSERAVEIVLAKKCPAGKDLTQVSFDRLADNPTIYGRYKCVQKADALKTASGGASPQPINVTVNANPVITIHPQVLDPRWGASVPQAGEKPPQVTSASPPSKVEAPPSGPSVEAPKAQ